METEVRDLKKKHGKQILIAPKCTATSYQESITKANLRFTQWFQTVIIYFDCLTLSWRHIWFSEMLRTTYPIAQHITEDPIFKISIPFVFSFHISWTLERGWHIFSFFQFFLLYLAETSYLVLMQVFSTISPFLLKIPPIQRKSIICETTKVIWHIFRDSSKLVSSPVQIMKFQIQCYLIWLHTIWKMFQPNLACSERIYTCHDDCMYHTIKESSR